MNKLRVLVIAVALLTVGMGDVHGQKLRRVLKRADSLLTERYRSVSFDTTYITRPQTKWTISARYNMSGADIEFEGREQGRRYHSRMSADYKSTVSLGVNYLGASFNISLNPAQWAGKYKDFELNLMKYANRWGVDFAYQDARNFSGWYDEDGTPRLHLDEDVLRMRSLNVNFYYAFNHQRFSYPAAFMQSYIQRRSAGSFLLALSGQGQRTETEGNKDFQSKLSVTNIGLGGGYGYNWVPGRHWLLHLSLLPTLIVYSNTSLTVNGDRVPLRYHFPEVILTSRLAVVRQLGNAFIGLTTVFTFTNIGDRDRLSVYNTKWLSRILVGYRF